MTRLKLTTWLRARMLPLVLSTAAVVAVSAPGAFYLRERADRVDVLRADASRIASVLRASIEARPRLWRYGTGKLAERLAEEGFARTPVQLADASGVGVPLDTAPLPPAAWALWGRADVTLDGRRVATVWVAADQHALVAKALELFIAFVLLAVLLGTVLYVVPLRAVAQAERRIELLLGRLAFALQQEDRRRIARELHDGAGQAITAARLELLAASARGELKDGSGIAKRLDEALDEVRRSTAMLAPLALAELGLPKALEQHCASFGGSTGVFVRCEVDAALPSLDPDVEAACYRIVQEALHNAVRHGGARQARVKLRRAAADSVSLEIGDDGKGLEAPLAFGHGLDGMRERAQLLGGQLHIDSQPGSGVRLVVTFPSQPMEWRA